MIKTIIQDVSYDVKRVTTGDYKLRPNPTTEQVTVEFTASDAGKVSLQILDRLGKVVLDKKITAVKGFNSEILNTGKFVTGVYFVVISTTNNTHAMRLIKMN
jgi:hypothetical protein